MYVHMYVCMFVCMNMCMYYVCMYRLVLAGQRLPSRVRARAQDGESKGAEPAAYHRRAHITLMVHILLYGFSENFLRAVQEHFFSRVEEDLHW